jgi:type IV pilus assembly protein PilA
LTIIFRYDLIDIDMTKRTAQKGFTLIELLVVIGILAILLSITLIAINPAKQFAQANNTQRQSDVNAILNAVWQYGVDNKGDLTALGIPTGVVGTDDVEIGSGVGMIDVCNTLTQVYIAQMPVDPQTGNWTDCTNYNTGYTVVQSAEGRVTVSAPDAEPIAGTAVVIQVSR